MTIRSDGANLTTIATGAAYRGAPDWGKAGIVFVESDAAAGESRLVLVQPDGSGRRVIRTERLRLRDGRAAVPGWAVGSRPDSPRRRTGTTTD